MKELLPRLEAVLCSIARSSRVWLSVASRLSAISAGDGGIAGVTASIRERGCPKTCCARTNSRPSPRCAPFALPVRRDQKGSKEDATWLNVPNPRICSNGISVIRRRPDATSADGEELELDVVWVAEHQRREWERLVPVPDAGVLDSELVEPGHPGLQVLARGHIESHVVQSATGLVERHCRRWKCWCADRSPDPSAGRRATRRSRCLPVRSGRISSVTGAAPRSRSIPGGAGFNVAHGGQGDVVKSR